MTNWRNDGPPPDVSAVPCPECERTGGLVSVGQGGTRHCRVHCDACGRITGMRPIWMYADAEATPPLWDRVEFNLRDELGLHSWDDLVILPDTPKHQGTAAITDALERRARFDCLRARREAALRLPKSMQNQSGVGRVDLFLQVPGDDQAMVIEIDSEPKAWSIDKLVYCNQELGHEALWIRWHNDRTRYVPPGIRQIDICAEHERLAKEDAEHLAWMETAEGKDFIEHYGGERGE